MADWTRTDWASITEGYDCNDGFIAAAGGLRLIAEAGPFVDWPTFLQERLRRLLHIPAMWPETRYASISLADTRVLATFAGVAWTTNDTAIDIKRRTILALWDATDAGGA